MATLELDENHAHYQIRSYQPGRIHINDKILTQSLIITPDQLIENWTPQTIQELTENCFTNIIDLHPDILLIGTGSQLEFIPLKLYGELMKLGIGVEIMNTQAACRTYNALASEERNVAAALIIH